MAAGRAEGGRDQRRPHRARRRAGEGLLQLDTTTNEAGYFAVPSLPLQPYGVRFSFLGYQPQDTSLTSGDETIAILLQPTALLSGEVVVEAVQEVLSVEPGVVKVPAQTLEKLPSFPGEADLFQALQWLPGVQKAGEINGGLIVRGLRNS